MEAIDLQLIFFAGLFVSLGLTPLCAWVAKRIGMVDRPGHRKIHHHAIPYLGGVGVIGSITLVIAVALCCNTHGAPLFENQAMHKGIAILGATLGMMLVGLVDDMKTLRPRYKFLGQVVVAWAFAAFGFRFEVLHIPGLPAMYLSYFAVPVTMFWLLAIVNAFNLIDGLDGLAASVSAGSLLMLTACSSVLGNTMGMAIALCGVGAVIGYLFYNWKPAKVYLGDAGSNGIGMFIAGSIVALGQNYGVSYYNPADIKLLGQPFVYQIVIATLLVSYPALEITLSVVRRIAHGRPISRADRGHVHHRLLKLGLGTRAIAIIALFLNIVPGLAVYQILVHYKGKAAWILMGYAVVVGIGLSLLGFFDFLKPKVMERLRPHFQIVHHFIEMQRAKMGLAVNRHEVLTLVEQTCREFGVQNCRILLIPSRDGKGGFDYTSQSKDQLALPTMLNFFRPAPKQAEKFRDQVKLADGKGGAHWMFAPHEGEEEIDMEYRVLFSEFMKEALETLAHIGEDKETIETAGVALVHDPAMSSHELRKRQRIET